MAFLRLNRNLILSLSLIALVTATTAAFQACSPVKTTGDAKSTSTQQSSEMAGGGGFDGKVYVSYGMCGAQIAVAQMIGVAPDGKSGKILRENCQDFSAAKPLAVASLKFAVGDNTVVLFNGAIYDQKIPLATQRVTREFCESPNVQSIVWAVDGVSDSLFGSVTRNDGSGASTGTLRLDIPAQTAKYPYQYGAAAGQSSKMTLTRTSSSAGSLLYSLGGGPQVTEAGLNCVTQTPPAKLNDGSQKAPVQTAQHPNLLSTYPVRPLWSVAGVDYAVGPQSAPIKNPNSISGMPGVTLDGSGGIRIDGPAGDGTVIDGYDFSLNPGAGIYISGAANVVIKNCKFLATSTTQAFINAQGAPGLSVTYSTFDGAKFGTQTRILGSDGDGVVLEYNWFLNFSRHVAEFLGGGPLSYRYNLIEESEWMPNTTSSNYSQFTGKGSSLTVYSHPLIAYNTVIQHPNVTNGGVAFEIYPMSATASDPEVAWNTVISAPSGVDLAFDYVFSFVQDAGADAVVVRGTVHDNFLDMRGAANLYRNTAPSVLFTNNIDLMSGQPL